MRGCWTWIGALCLGLLTAGAAADAGKVAVRPFQGPGAKRVRAAVVQVLKRQGGLSLLDNRQVDTAADELGVDATTDAGQSELSQMLFLDYWVEGRVRRSGGKLFAEIRVQSSAKGTGMTASYHAGGPALLAKRVRRDLWKDVAAEIGRQAPQAEAPRGGGAAPYREPAPVDDLGDDAYGDLAGVTATHNPVQVSAGLTSIRRSFSYTDNRSDLSNYSQGFVPALALDVRVYPLAHVEGVGGALGIEAGTRMTLGVVRSKNADGEEFPTETRAFHVGARGRHFIAEHELGLGLGIASHAFEIEQVDDQSSGVPGVSYLFGRIGLDGRFFVYDRFAVGAGFAYLLPLSFGEIADDGWFPRASGGGIDGLVSAGYELAARRVELQLGIRVSHYFLTMNPDTEDPDAATRLAGGAQDTYPAGFASITWRLEGRPVP
ncbi:MAG: hypothetical protein OXT09_00015 [Myxococcales bacterium]|nr:hypothetical protein [Myxococcales bacterium]